jgi:hypothetical protein
LKLKDEQDDRSAAQRPVTLSAVCAEAQVIKANTIATLTLAITGSAAVYAL